MTTSATPICVMCARLNTDSAFPVTCTAFPEGISEAIFLRGYDHRKPFTGDKGLTFTLETGKEVLLKQWEELHD